MCVSDLKSSMVVWPQRSAEITTQYGIFVPVWSSYSSLSESLGSEPCCGTVQEKETEHTVYKMRISPSLTWEKRLSLCAPRGRSLLLMNSSMGKQLCSHAVSSPDEHLIAFCTDQGHFYHLFILVFCPVSNLGGLYRKPFLPFLLPFSRCKVTGVESCLRLTSEWPTKYKGQRLARETVTTTVERTD